MNGEVDSLVNFPIDTSLKTIAHSAMAQALNKFEFKDFAKMIPSAPIFPLSLSNSLSFA